MDDLMYYNLPSIDEPVMQTKQELREEIARHTEEFLARGGEITYLPYDWSAELVDRAASRVMYASEFGTDSRTDEEANSWSADDIVEDFDEPYV